MGASIKVARLCMQLDRLAIRRLLTSIPVSVFCQTLPFGLDNCASWNCLLPDDSLA
jgi:hypothetical protein